jgi:prepilin-type N-terminal cleavage/methylation domain-containing protein
MAKEFVENNGFTLVELLIAMAISGILVTSMYSVYILQQRSYTVQDQVSEIQQKARAALDIMTREIRMAAYDPDKNCAAAIQTADPTTLAFETCDPGDELCPECRVTFKLEGDELKMTRDQARDDTPDAGILVTSMYSVYTLQQRSYTVQDQVSEIQQKARAALDIMTREIRMAAYDPGKNCAATIQDADEMLLVFDTCDPDDVECSECRVTFRFDKDTDILQMTKDQGRDDAPDAGGLDNLPLTIARGVDAIEFRYLDENGVDTTNTSAISTVQISMLVRATYPDRKYTNTTLYEPASVRDLGGVLEAPWDDLNGSGGNPAHDKFHRRLLITTVQMRNARL